MKGTEIMKKSKITCLSLAALTACGAFSGCAEGNEKLLDPDDPVTVTVWHYYNGVQQASFDRMVQEFNDTEGFEKGIIVEAHSSSSVDELSESVLAAVDHDAGADDPPDIFAAYSETAFVLDKMGALAEIGQYLTDEELGEYVEGYISEGIFSGDRLMIFPTAKSTEVMMVNKTAWDKFAEAEGVSADELSTLEGLAAAAEKYYNYTDGLTPDVPGDGKAFFGRDSIANYMYIGAKQLGCEYFTFDENGKVSVSVDKEVMRKLRDNYYVPYVKGYFGEKGRYRSDDIKTGEIISLVCSTTGAAYFPSEVTVNDDEIYPIECMVLPAPVFADGELYMVQQGAGMSVLSSDSRSEYASVQFLKWFTEEERNTEFSVTSGYLPVRTSANSIEKITAVNNTLESPMEPVMLETIGTAISGIRSHSMYTCRPFGKSAECRNYIGSAMQKAAADDYAAVMERIAAGEDRDAVLSDYLSDEAFDKWYESFVSGLEEIVAD